MNNLDLTIIIPAYNEEEGILKTIETLYNQIKHRKWRILVINDGSQDSTGIILQKIEYIEVINHPYNKGYGASLKTGINKAETNLIAFYDADGQHRPEDLINLVDNLKSYDMLIGQRDRNSYQKWMRKPGKWLLSKVANFLTGRKIPDLNSGMRVISKSVISKMLHLFPDGFSFSTTSTIAFLNMGYNVGYYPIVVNKRFGRSSVNQLKHGSKAILLIIRLIVLFNPLKVFIPVSIILIIIGILYEIIFGILLTIGVDFLPAALFLFLSGVLIFFFGLLVDQVSELRKHLNSNNN